MALRSKLLGEKVVKSAEKMLKEVRNKRIRFKKTKCCNYSKKAHYNGCSTKIYSLSRKALELWLK